MKSSIKSLQDIGGLNDLRTYTGAVRKSGKPDLPTTAIMGLYMRRNEKDRIEGELKRLKKRKIQLQKKLVDTEKDITKFYEKATKVALEMRGSTSEESVLSKEPKGKGKMVLEY
ncbi:MAG: hypothetical protein ABIC82_05490 [bacterium]